jgi:hypothetical protein
MAKGARKYGLRQTMMKRLCLVLAPVILGIALPALAQDIPNCALTGSMTMMIGGRPALRLSDVVNCPADAYDIIKSVEIDGQPMVHLKPVTTGKTRCITLENPGVTAENKQANTVGDMACSTVK